jgi:hypothetical protein
LTLLTVDYFRWRPTIHCRLSALVASSFANHSLHALTLFLRSSCLKVDMCEPDREHLALPSILRRVNIVASETTSLCMKRRNS